jgi:YVTN family beta-propeller protein
VPRNGDALLPARCCESSNEPSVVIGGDQSAIPFLVQQVLLLNEQNSSLPASILRLQELLVQGYSMAPQSLVVEALGDLYAIFECRQGFCDDAQRQQIVLLFRLCAEQVAGVERSYFGGQKRTITDPVIETNSIDTPALAPTTLDIGPTRATLITIGSATTSNTLNLGGAASTVNIQNMNVTGDYNSAAGDMTLSSGDLTLLSGSSTFTANGNSVLGSSPANTVDVAGRLNIATAGSIEGTTGTLNIATVAGVTPTVNIATGASTQTINVGGVGDALNIDAGTMTVASATRFNGVLKLDSLQSFEVALGGSGALNIATDGTTATLNLGTGTTGGTTIGSISKPLTLNGSSFTFGGGSLVFANPLVADAGITTSSITSPALTLGTGAGAVNAGNIVIQPANGSVNGGSVTIDTGTGGSPAIAIGGTNARAITVGASASAQTIAIGSGGAGTKTITIGEMTIPATHDTITIGGASNYFNLGVPGVAERTVLVHKGPIQGPNEFNTIQAALNYLGVPGVAWTIDVAPGVYSENNPLFLQANITIAGDGNAKISAQNPGSTILVGAPGGEVIGIGFDGATTPGTAAIRYSGTAASGESFFITNCYFYNNNTQVAIDDTNLLSLVVMQNCFINAQAAFTNGITATASHGNTILLSLHGLNWYNAGASTPTLVSLGGPNCFGTLSNITIGKFAGIPVGTGVSAYNGAVASVKDSGFYRLATAITTTYTFGDAAPQLNIQSTSGYGDTADVTVLHPGTTGLIQGVFEKAKVTIVAGAPIAASFADSVAGGSIAVGPQYWGDTMSTVASMRPLVEHGAALGTVDGGVLSNPSGTDIHVTAGSGYLMVGTPPNDYLKYITWSATSPDLTLAANEFKYVYVDNTGTVLLNSALPDPLTQILLGAAQADNAGTAIVYMQQEPRSVIHAPTNIDTMLQDGIGPVYESGSVVSKDVDPSLLKLDVTDGEYYFGQLQFNPSGATPITFATFYRSATPPIQVITSGVSLVDYDHYDDSSGTLATITPSSFAKHALYVVGTLAATRYLMVYGQTEFATVQLAENGPIPTPPSAFGGNVALIASIIVKNAAVVADRISEIRDERPRVGFKASGLTVITNHNDLTGRGVPDAHDQYLRTDGTNYMTGSLQLLTGVNRTSIASGAIGAGWTLTLPTTAGGSGQALTTDGTGTCSWTGFAPAGNYIINGGQNGPLTIGTSNNTAMDFITSGGIRLTVANDGKITVANALYADGGVDRSSAAALNLGTTNANAVNIGRSGTATPIAVGQNAGDAVTIAGNLVIPNSTSTPTGVVYKGSVAVGNQFIHNTGTDNTCVGVGAGNLNMGTNTATDNTALGYNALTGITTGDYNTVVGSTAGDAITTGGNNTALGYGALGAATTTSDSTAVGYNALALNTATDNTAVGSGTLAANTTGTCYTAVGSQSLPSASGAGFVTAVGFQAGYNVTSGSTSVFVGDRITFGAGSSVTGGYNTVIGSAAAYNLAGAGANNTIVGGNAGFSIGTGTDSTAIGYNALYANTATGSTAVGSNALAANTSGTGSTAIGYHALLLATGNNNTAVGYEALKTTVAGAGNIALGYQAGGSLAASNSNNIDIGNVGTAGDSGAIRIGTNASQTSCYVQGISGVTPGGTPSVVVVGSGGQLGTSGAIGNYYVQGGNAFGAAGVLGITDSVGGLGVTGYGLTVQTASGNTTAGNISVQAGSGTTTGGSLILKGGSVVPAGYAYVANSSVDTVSVIDLTTNTITATWPAGLGFRQPKGVAITPNGSYVYVTNSNPSFGNSVSVIRVSDGSLVTTVGVGTIPFGIAITPNGLYAYVANLLSNSVSVIQTSTNTVVATVGVGTNPQWVAITPNGSYAYVTNSNGNSVSVIRTSDNTVVATVGVGAYPIGVAVTPDGSYAYVTNANSNSVSVIQTSSNTVVATVGVGTSPQAAAITPNGSYVYVANSNGNSVSVIRTSDNTVVATVGVGVYPIGIAITPDGSYAYVTNSNDNTVSVIITGTNTVIGTLTGFNQPVGIGIFGLAGASGGSVIIDSGAVGTNQAVTIGGTNARNVNLGRSGEVTDVKGNFQVDGTIATIGVPGSPATITLGQYAGSSTGDTVLIAGGAATGAKSVNIATGGATGGLSSITVGSAATASTIILGQNASGADTVTIAGGANASGVKTVNIATASTATGPNLVTIGSTGTPTTLKMGQNGSDAVSVAGNLVVPNSTNTPTGVVYKGSIAVGNQFIHNTGTGNTCVGQGAGNLSMGTNAAVNNTALGYHALTGITTGVSNTAIGETVMASNVQGHYNIGVGCSTDRATFQALTTGNQNVAVGAAALSSITTQSNNTAVGHDALKVNTTDNNTAVGFQALAANTTGASNTGIGFSALCFNTTGGGNTALGLGALFNTNVSNNTAVGVNALGQSQGNNNTAVGYYALDANNMTGTDCTAVGYQALLANTANGNTAVGSGALAASTSGGGNTAVGYHALTGMTGSQAGNTAVGYEAAAAPASGSSAFTAIGYQALKVNASGYWSTAIGAGALSTSTGGVSNTAIGFGVMRAIVVGNYNVGVGGHVEFTTNYTLGLLTSGSNNVAVGTAALASVTTGTDNTAVGHNALRDNTASTNTAVGSNALVSNTSGASNTGIGFSALYYNTTGAANTALGLGALFNTNVSNNTAVGVNALGQSQGNNNTAVGYYALDANNMVGTDCTAVGYQALLANTAVGITGVGSGALAANTSGTGSTAVGYHALLSATGNNNTALGYAAGDAIVSGTDNTAVGYNALTANTATGITGVGSGALAANTSGTENTAVGREALRDNTDGTLNTAVGYQALLVCKTIAADSGIFDTAVGAEALVANTTGMSNTAVGAKALWTNAIGHNNAAVGHGALSSCTGTSNTALGYSAGFNCTSGSSNVYIGANMSGVAGESNACYIASINGQTSTSGVVVYVNSSDKLGTSTSSARFKENIVTIPDSNTDKFMQLRPVSFTYKEDASKLLNYGLIAEEVEPIYPEMIYYGKDGLPFTIRYQFLDGIFVHEIQKDHSDIQAVQAEIADLPDMRTQLVAAQEQISYLSTQVAELQALVKKCLGQVAS